MGKKARSAKGEMVDFDYLKIKEQLASSPTPMEVKNRQNFIENRLKRRLKKNTIAVEKVNIDVEPILPSPTESVAIKQDETPADVKEKSTGTTKQKARKKKIT